jgi:rSAM/selenodomain-associated transferase 2
MISVIIPTLNEQDVIADALAALLAEELEREIIVVDGGSRDRTEPIVRSFGGPVSFVSQDLTKPRGRATAYNQAARHSSGDSLVFLHADTRLPNDGLRLIEGALADHRIVGGGFLPSFDLAGPRPQGRALSLVERGWRLRTRRFHWFAGDQAPFIRRKVFVRCGGYPSVRLAEDWAFASLLRSLGHTAIIESPVRVSPRRHLANGVVKTLLVTGSVEIMYRAGVDPHFLASWYRRWLPRDRG